MSVLRDVFRAKGRSAVTIFGVAVGVFMVVLTSHFVFGWPGGLAVLLSGIPVVYVIVTSLGFGRRKKE